MLFGVGLGFYRSDAVADTVLFIPIATIEDQSGNFFTRERELFTRVVAEYVRE